MTVQELSDRLLELSHQHGLVQAEVCFVRDRQLVTVREAIIVNDNLVMLSSIPSLKDTDLEVIKQVLGEDSTYATFEQALCNKSVIKVAEHGDYKQAYKDFIEDEKQYAETSSDVSYETFIQELNKGYGKSGCVQIARLFELSGGIYYDNEYC